MKRQGPGRVLTFAVTGALLGGGMVGCGHRPPGGKFVNARPVEPPPGPSVNPGPADVGQPPAEPEPPENVNEGPVDEPPAEVTPTNPEPQPEPEPPSLDPGTNNVRKVEEPRRRKLDERRADVNTGPQ